MGGLPVIALPYAEDVMWWYYISQSTFSQQTADTHTCIRNCQEKKEDEIHTHVKHIRNNHQNREYKYHIFDNIWWNKPSLIINSDQLNCTASGPF